jgi:aldehyde dehydrogenase (NAD(P)+)
VSAPEVPPPTPLPQLERAVARVKEASPTFARLPITERIRLLESMLEGYHRVAADTVRAACLAKGIPPDEAMSGEEWINGPLLVVRNCRLLMNTLRQLAAKGAPRFDPTGVRPLPNGGLSVRCYPLDALEGTLLMRHDAQTHLQPGVDATNLHEHVASFYRKPHGGRVCLVLGGGNVNAIPPTDCLAKMFIEGATCVLKMNPVNAYLGPFIERAFRAAIDRDFLAVVYGGADEGQALMAQPGIDEVHVTGSAETYDAMVWGPAGPERDARKARNEPLLTKEVSAELGNITPVLWVPGPYDAGELSFQGHNIAGMVSNNASFNCVAAKLIVTSRRDPQRPALLEQMTRGLEKAAPRKPYYPGTEERFTRFLADYPDARKLGAPKRGELPFTVIQGLDARNEKERAFHVEPWCPIVSEAALDAVDPLAFLDEAVRFVNERVWGSLCAVLIVHPKLLEDPIVGAAVERAIADLRYGSVAVNTWPGASFGLMSLPWGGHPAAGSPRDIQSGRGFVHNTLMLERVEKGVLRAPVKTFPVMPWFPGHRSLDVLGRRLTDFEADPSWLKVPGMAAAGMKA